MTMLAAMLPRNSAADASLFHRIAAAEHESWLAQDRDSPAHRTYEAYRVHCERWNKREVFDRAVKWSEDERRARYREVKEI